MSHLDTLSCRLLAIKRGPSHIYDQHTRSCVMLMREYLRRLTVSYHALTGQPPRPFLDLAQLINPKVRADEALVNQVAAHIHQYCGAHAALLSKNALHFAALLDAGEIPAGVLGDIYEPFVALLERGASLGHEGAGFIDVDAVGVPVRDMASFQRHQPFVSLGTATLDRLDEQDQPMK